MDRTMISLILAVNVVSLAIVYQRLVTQGIAPPIGELVNLDRASSALSFLSGHPREAPCGFIDESSMVLVSSRVVFPDGVSPGAVTIKNGKIVSILRGTPPDIQGLVMDFTPDVISPGVIDVHVHLNEPGREHWEGLDTGTSAATKGGITAVVEMPLNSDPTITTAALLRNKMAVTKDKTKVDMGFWGGIVPQNAGNYSELQAMLDEGALGFKSFLSPSGINDFDNVSISDVARALPFLMKVGVPYFLHSELVEPVEVEGDPRVYTTYLKSRPPSFEHNAIAALIKELMKAADTTQPKSGFVLHIAHLADWSSLPALEVAKAQLPISVETSPHHLLFTSEDIPEGQTQYKCVPPIREPANREHLVEGVRAGIIDLVSSDHSPSPLEMKLLESGDFLKAWGGISGLQYLLPVTWTALKDQQGFDLVKLSQLLSVAPAKLAGWSNFKGKIEVGYDADIVVWSPESPADTSVPHNSHRHKLSAYTDKPLLGEVVTTFVRGRQVYDKTQGVYNGFCGQITRRGK